MDSQSQTASEKTDHRGDRWPSRSTTLEPTAIEFPNERQQVSVYDLFGREDFSEQSAASLGRG
jgi:hypothetical protein